MSTGQVDISATYGSLISTAHVSVVGLVSIAIAGTSTALLAGDSTQLGASGTFSDGSQKDLATLVTWQSSDVTVATVSTTGVATAVGPGQVVIRASYLGVTGTQSATVTSVRSITISGVPQNIVVIGGTSTQLVATASLSDGTMRDVTGRAVWASTNPPTATVSPTGLLAAVHYGGAEIHASLSGVMGRQSVIVIDPGPTIQHFWWTNNAGGGCGNCSPMPGDAVEAFCTVTDPDATVLTITLTVIPDGAPAVTIGQTFPINTLPPNVGASVIVNTVRAFGTPPRGSAQCHVVDDHGRTSDASISASQTALPAALMPVQIRPR
jgi:hypothetical protein